MPASIVWKVLEWDGEKILNIKDLNNLLSGIIAA